MGWLTGLLRGGSAEISWDDLVGAVVDRIAELGHWGARGEVALPEELVVTIAVPDKSLGVVRGFVKDARFDPEVSAMVANRVDRAAHEVPPRDYVVAAGERFGVTVREAEPRTWELAISGGDFAGKTFVLPPTGDVVFGRGSGAGDGPRSDLVVCEQTAYVSRRAGRLIRIGHRLEVAALDQGDLLVVRRASGEVVRPARTARGRVLLEAGDVIELADGRADSVRISVRRAAG